MKTRVGNFSSSEIWKLTKSGRGKNEYFGATALTYIEEKSMELRLGRPLHSDHDSKPTSWGTFIEEIAFQKVPIEYSLVSNDRYFHESIDHWTGMPDILSDNKCGDIKCPWTLKSFCKLVDAKNIDLLKEISPEYYWQLISNCILTGKSIASLFVYVPYFEDLKKIRMISGIDKFFLYSNDNDFPWIIKDGYYTDLNHFEFEVQQNDIDFLTERVEKAVKKLKEYKLIYNE